MTTVALLDAGPQDAATRLLAHGAGAPMDSPFMETVSALLAARGMVTTRFEFAYMAARRTTARKRLPPKAESLVQEYVAMIAQVRGRMPPGQRLLIGGKSMGGRVASLLADRMHGDGSVAGLVCLGYPFHPPEKPDQLRTDHLQDLKCPALIVQGDRDPFGTRAEVEALVLAPTIAFHWAPDGDHDLGPRGASGHTRRGNLEAAADAIVAFAAGERGRRRVCLLGGPGGAR
jgi:uncharacterized protein